MASLQERLDAAFGALAPTGAAPQWKPTEQQVFRAGAPITDEGNSSDEEQEYLEKQRRESVPGLAQALVEEDEPDAEGFRPSTAFCRQLDAEEEYSFIDEVATGMISRRTGEALPPRDMQVLDNNIYEERMRQRAAAAAAGGASKQQPPTHMEVEEPEGSPAAVQPAAQPVGQPAASEHMLGAETGNGGEEARAEKRRVRFEGVPGAHAEPASTSRHQTRQKSSRGAGLRQVPDHVKHPEKYTCYVLDEPLVVGGGVAQLADGQHNQRQQLPPAAAVAEPEQEPERWQGPPGAIKFVPRQSRAGEGPPVIGSGAAEPAQTARTAGLQQPASVSFGEDEAQAAEVEGDAAMQGAPAGAASAARSNRQYRARRAAAQEHEEQAN